MIIGGIKGNVISMMQYKCGQCGVVMGIQVGLNSFLLLRVLSYLGIEEEINTPLKISCHAAVPSVFNLIPLGFVSSVIAAFLSVNIYASGLVAFCKMEKKKAFTVAVVPTVATLIIYLILFKRI